MTRRSGSPRPYQKSQSWRGWRVLAGELGDLDEDDGAAHDRTGFTGADGVVRLGYRVQARPGAHADVPIERIIVGRFGRRRGPGRRILAGELGAVTLGATVADVSGRVRIGVEAPIAAQPHQDRHVGVLPGRAPA